MEDCTPATTTTVVDGALYVRAVVDDDLDGRQAAWATWAWACSEDRATATTTPLDGDETSRQARISAPTIY